jgi:acyl carrier protein
VPGGHGGHDEGAAMTDHNYLILLQAVLRQVSERSLGEIRPENLLTELGIDSIALAEVVVRIEAEVGTIEVPMEQWLRVRSVHEVVEIMEKALADPHQKRSQKQD